MLGVVCQWQHGRSFDRIIVRGNERMKLLSIQEDQALFEERHESSVVAQKKHQVGRGLQSTQELCVPEW